jgi:hypothetical protein
MSGLMVPREVGLGKKMEHVQSFIFCWSGYEQRAAVLQQMLAPITSVSVINSGAAPPAANGSWINLDESAYFAAQWNQAVALFDADILFHMQSDAHSDHLPEVITRAAMMFERYPIGIYEPYTDYSDIQYDRDKLDEIDRGVFEVPWTDCTCWFIRREIVRQLPKFDLRMNSFGWGICRVAAALCSLAGKLCVRDYTYRIHHPKKRGYSSVMAMSQLEQYIGSQTMKVRREIARLAMRRESCRVP